MTSDPQRFARASLLAVELMDICHAAAKPLAADFVQAAIDYLTDRTEFRDVSDRWPTPTKDRSREN